MRLSNAISRVGSQSGALSLSAALSPTRAEVNYLWHQPAKTSNAEMGQSPSQSTRLEAWRHCVQCFWAHKLHVLGRIVCTLSASVWPSGHGLLHGNSWYTQSPPPPSIPSSPSFDLQDTPCPYYVHAWSDGRQLLAWGGSVRQGRQLATDWTPSSTSPRGTRRMDTHLPWFPTASSTFPTPPLAKATTSSLPGARNNQVLHDYTKMYEHNRPCAPPAPIHRLTAAGGGEGLDLSQHPGLALSPMPPSYPAAAGRLAIGGLVVEGEEVRGRGGFQHHDPALSSVGRDGACLLQWCHILAQPHACRRYHSGK